MNGSQQELCEACGRDMCTRLWILIRRIFMKHSNPEGGDLHESLRLSIGGYEARVGVEVQRQLEILCAALGTVESNLGSPPPCR